MDIYNAIQAQLGVLGVMLAAASTHEAIQESIVNLPETFDGNEKGRRTISKKDLETLIDSRWKSQVRRLEEQLAELERRVAWTEGKLGEPGAKSATEAD
jgi:hypothetical protein